MSANLVKFLNQYSFEYVIKATGEKINFKPITTGQMKHLLTYEDEEKESIEDILDDVIMECVTTEGFNIKSISVQDRFDLLVELRKKSKGDSYSFMVRCPDCKRESFNNVDINELEIVPYPKDIDKIVKLSDDLSVEMDHITRAQQKEVTEKVKALKDLSELERTLELHLYIYAITMKKFKTPVGEETEVSFEEKLNLVEKLDDETFNKLTKWFTDNDYGTEFKYTLKCNGCEFSEERNIPISDFFV